MKPNQGMSADELLHYPPEQIGKRASLEEVQRASEADPRSPEDAALLRREGVYAGEKLTWLRDQSHRPDWQERAASAGSTVALAWPELRPDIERGHASRTERQAWAQRPRADALSRTLTDILRRNPSATRAQLLDHLNNMAHLPGSPIETVTAESIEWTDAQGRARTTPLSALKDRVSRARRRAR